MKSTLSLVFLALYISLLPVEPVEAQQHICKCFAKPGNAFTAIPAPPQYEELVALGLENSGSILLEFEGVISSDFQNAIKKARDIWASLLDNPVDIRIHIKYENFDDPNVLAATGISTYRNGTGLPVTDKQYPISLAKQKDQQINYTEPDIEISFNPLANWSYNLDGIPVENKIDLVTVALHEIAHGLAFHPSFTYSSQSGSFGYSGYPANENATYPTIYDNFLFSGSDKLISLTNGIVLGQKITGNNVVFNAVETRKANFNNAVKIYAPATWEGGSSISHFDETTYGEGTPQSLMTPQFAAAEVVHDPGAVALALMKDLGWPLKRYICFDTPIGGSTSYVKGTALQINWFDNTDATSSIHFDLYRIVGNTLQLIPKALSGLPNQINSSPGRTGNTYSWSIPASLDDGAYYLKASSSGSTPAISGQSHLFNIHPNPAVPLLSPAGGVVPVLVTASCSTPDAQIRYRTDGGDPTETSQPFPVDGLVISQPCTLKVRSFFTLPNLVVAMSAINQGLFVQPEANEQSITFTAAGQYLEFNSQALAPGIKIGKNPSGSYSVNRSRISWQLSNNSIPSNAIITRAELILPFSQYLGNPSKVNIRKHTTASGAVWDIFNAIGTEELIGLLNFNPSSNTVLVQRKMEF